MVRWYGGMAMWLLRRGSVLSLGETFSRVHIAYSVYMLYARRRHGPRLWHISKSLGPVEAAPPPPDSAFGIIIALLALSFELGLKETNPPTTGDTQKEEHGVVPLMAGRGGRSKPPPRRGAITPPSGGV